MNLQLNCDILVLQQHFLDTHALIWSSCPNGFWMLLAYASPEVPPGFVEVVLSRGSLRLWMRRWAFLVVRPQLSSPNPNISKPRSRTENSDFWSWLTHQLLGRWKSTIPNLQIYLPKKANSEKLGLGIDNPCRIGRSAWRGVMTDIFGILESSATHWYQDVNPTQEFFFSSSHL